MLLSRCIEFDNRNGATEKFEKRLDEQLQRNFLALVSLIYGFCMALTL